MRFEHLIEVNDFLNPLIERLTREQLWNGLVLSAEEPALFLPGLDRSTLLARTGDTIDRELAFGRAVVRDRVRLFPLERLEFHSERSALTPEARRIVTIEEPEPGELFVRFAYERKPQGHPPLCAEDARILAQAWLKADVDLIVKIRALAGAATG
jgi:acetylaranotin biosynthesis cluster protein L